jgi:lactoylglutathione lyase
MVNFSTLEFEGGTMEDPAPELRNVDCIRLYVPDIETGLLFYRDCLGHQLIWRTEDSVGLRMPDSETEIVLHTTKHQPPEIDIRVQSADDAVERIKDAGGNIIEPPFDIRIGRCAIVQDPWGNEFVILDISKGLLVTDSEGNIIGNTPPKT